jgi:hypothetical protein
LGDKSSSGTMTRKTSGRNVIEKRKLKTKKKLTPMKGGDGQASRNATILIDMKHL